MLDPRTLVAVVQLILGITYPILIFMSLSWFEPRFVAMFVFGFAALRLLLFRTSAAIEFAKAAWVPTVAVGAVALFTAIWNDSTGLLLGPVLINVALLATFGLSLRSESPMVERFARSQVHDLVDAEIRYCRSVTILWCVFFVANGSAALYFALAGDIEAWALFTGLISYLLIGTVFLFEYIYRHWRFRRYLGGFADPVLKLFFPPRAN